MIEWYYIEKNLQLCSLNTDVLEGMINRLFVLEAMLEFEDDNEYFISEAYSIINTIRENQFDPITHGTNYNQTAILNHLKKLK
jgi:hypothetical protein